MEGELIFLDAVGTAQLVADAPFVGEVKKFPFATAFCASVIVTVFLFRKSVVLSFAVLRRLRSSESQFPVDFSSMSGFSFVLNFFV